MKFFEENLSVFEEKSKERVSRALESVKQKKPAFLDCTDFDISSLKKFTDPLKKEFDAVVVVGIGGSSLGAKALLDLLNPYQEKVFFLENNDSYEVNRILNKKLNQERLIICVISKSGRTLETKLNFEILRSKFPKAKVVAISDRDSELHKTSIQNNWDFLEIPKNLGGRFSVLSNVGFFPLEFSGIDCAEILEGAKTVKSKFLDQTFESNFILKYAISHFIHFKNQKRNIFVLMPYGTRWRNFSFWWEQLVGESLGKNLSTGPTPLPALGSVDQHSLVQLFRDGPDDKVFTFLREKVNKDDLEIHEIKSLEYLEGKKLNDILLASEEGTRKALIEAKKPAFLIEIDESNCFEIGKLVLFFEMFVALLAELFQINAYDQPGVEAGKIKTKEILKK